MLKYRCLVLDHDDTVVQTMRTLSYPFWCLELEQFRPGTTMTLEDYILKSVRFRRYVPGLLRLYRRRTCTGAQAVDGIHYE